MAAGQSETSSIAPVKVRTGNPQQRRSGKGPSTQKYIATKVTEGRDANGKPTFTKEVIRYDDDIESGSELKVKEAGKMRLEGKEYIVSDGDIMHFRFNI